MSEQNPAAISGDEAATRRVDEYRTIFGSAVVLLIAIAFAAGIPLVDRALPDPADVGSGKVLEVARGASFKAEGGWHLDRRATERIPVTVLSRDADTFTVTAVPHDEAQDNGWFEDSGAAGNGRVRYGERVSFTTDSALEGETYYFQGQDLAGRVWLIDVDDQGTTVQAVLHSTPPDFENVFPDAEKMAQSIAIEDGDE